MIKKKIVEEKQFSEQEAVDSGPTDHKSKEGVLTPAVH